MADVTGAPLGSYPRTPDGDSCYITDNDKYPKYKGVRKRKWGKWVSEVRLPNSRERIWLGSFDTPQKAARAFDAAQFCLRGRCARFNFPDDPPHFPGGESLSPQEIQVVAARFANEISSDTSHHHQQEQQEKDIGHHDNTHMVNTDENSSFSSSQEQSQQNHSYHDEDRPHCYGSNYNHDVAQGDTDWSFLNSLEYESGSGSANNNYEYSSFDPLFYDNHMHYSGHDFYYPAVPALQDSDSAREEHYSQVINGDDFQQQYSSFLWNF